MFSPSEKEKKLMSEEILKEIFDKQEDLVQSAVIEQAVKVLKKKVFEKFIDDTFDLLVNGNTKYLLNRKRRTIQEMEEEEVRVLCATCLTHSIASFGARYLCGGEPLVLI